MFNVTAAYVEFVDSAVTVLETSVLNHIALKRSGYLQANMSVKCQMSGGTAMGGSSFPPHPDDDFFLAPLGETVHFNPGQTDQGTLVRSRMHSSMTATIFTLVMMCVCACLFFVDAVALLLIGLCFAVACTLFVVDNHMFEGRENMSIWLKAVNTSETEVILSSNTSSVTVYIMDLEDGKRTQQ